MEKIKQMFQSKKKIVCGSAVALLAIIVVIGIALVNKEEVVKLKQDSFNVAVNGELDKTPDSYLSGMKNPEDATVNDESVKMDVLGTYDFIIRYKNIEYKVKINVQDVVSPVLKLEQEKYVFTLNSSIDEVNETINEDVTITDNYDKEFDLLTIVDSIPETEKEVNVKLSIKDTSDNESNVISLVIQFTEDGEEKEGLEKEEKEVKTTAKANASEPTVIPKPESEPEVDPTPEKDPEPTPDNGTATKPDSKPTPPSVTPTPTPEPTPPPVTPTPQPEPTPPVVKPTPPSYTTPEGALDGGVFATDKAGWEWVYKFTDDPNSKYYYCNAQGNQLSDGTWHFYIHAPK